MKAFITNALNRSRYTHKLKKPKFIVILYLFLVLSIPFTISRYEIPNRSEFVKNFYSNDEYQLENATFVSLVRNKEIWKMAESIRSVEDRFNDKYHYNWLFINDEQFTEQFKTTAKTLCSGKVTFSLIPKEHWGYPEHIDLERAKESRKRLELLPYGDSESYRHMCRYQSGFFFQDPELLKYKYYWRVEPGVKFYCDITYDLFKYMRQNDLYYGFTITITDLKQTIETLWETTKEFLNSNPNIVSENNLFNFISDDNGESYNTCHFWSNFEIGNMDFWRGETYQNYFKHLDEAGGFFYERWGDAPIHSLAASLFLPKDKIHYFKEIGYSHNPYTHCPIDEAIRKEYKCDCNPGIDMTWERVACTDKYYNAMGFEIPEKIQKIKNKT